jgi:hypothetical protein
MFDCKRCLHVCQRLCLHNTSGTAPGQLAWHVTDTSAAAAAAAAAAACEQVVGEIIAGVLLVPSVLGRIPGERQQQMMMMIRM